LKFKEKIFLLVNFLKKKIILFLKLDEINKNENNNFIKNVFIKIKNIFLGKNKNNKKIIKVDKIGFYSGIFFSIYQMNEIIGDFFFFKFIFFF
jgi:hypothetical protein